MRVLVATRLKKTPEEAAEGELACTRIREKGLVAVPDDTIDWGDLFCRMGGRDAAYEHMARQHDHLALVEGWDEENDYFISKGQHSLLLHFLADGKSASVWRGGEGKIVQGVTLVSNDWAGPYACVVTDEERSS